MKPFTSQVSSGITILIPTYNRAQTLRETLASLVGIERRGLDCQFVVINNNCTDDTPLVLTEYSSKLPLVFLKEPQPGKNCALNRALRECELKELVAFLDDDITPGRDWLSQIAASADKWPDVPIFGGRIDLLWPEGKPPGWASADWIRDFAFCAHHYAAGETLYKAPACPFGGNYWVRRSVFHKAPCFDETIGPRPTNRIMGSETSFLRNLQTQGFPMLYFPGAVVEHRIMAKECTIPALRRRAYTFGRGQVRLHGWHRDAVRRRSSLFWVLLMLADWAYTSVQFARGWIARDKRVNCETTVSAMMRFGVLKETATQVRRVAWERLRKLFKRHSAPLPAQEADVDSLPVVSPPSGTEASIAETSEISASAPVRNP